MRDFPDSAGYVKITNTIRSGIAYQKSSANSGNSAILQKWAGNTVDG
jgi:hypothetical protein